MSLKQRWLLRGAGPSLMPLLYGCASACQTASYTGGGGGGGGGGEYNMILKYIYMHPRTQKNTMESLYYGQLWDDKMCPD